VSLKPIGAAFVPNLTENMLGSYGGQEIGASEFEIFDAAAISSKGLCGRLFAFFHVFFVGVR
jgi:hypothetical protein